MQVLLIEPNQVLAKTYVQALAQDGHKTQVCLRAQDAITLSDQTKPDLVICELFMGEHNGMEFLYEFRSYSDWQDVPIIVLSMAANSELAAYKAALRQLNVLVCLYKPQTTLAQLRRTINTLLPVPS